MVKRWINSRGPALTGAPNGDWVKHDDYQALQAALKEALDRLEKWERWNTNYHDDSAELKWISELRQQFLSTTDSDSR